MSFYSVLLFIILELNCQWRWISNLIIPLSLSKQIQDRTLPTVRGGWRVQVRGQVPIRPRIRRVAQFTASSPIQDRAVSHLPQCRLLSLWPTMPFRAQCRRGPCQSATATSSALSAAAAFSSAQHDQSHDESAEWTAIDFSGATKLVRPDG